LVEELCQECVSQIVELKEEEQASCLKIQWQLYLNLMGLSNNTVEFKGKALDETDIVFTDPVGAMFALAKNIACNLFGEYEMGAHISIEKGYQQFLKLKGGPFFAMVFSFHRALSLYAMARKDKKKKSKYIAEAKRLRKVLVFSLKKGNPNVSHYVSLLNAEHAALKEKKNKEKTVDTLYKDAILSSTRGGYVHDAALAHVRFADFLLSEVGDTQEAGYHIQKAIKCYNNWDAMAIVEYLHNQHEEILAGSSANCMLTRG